MRNRNKNMKPKASRVKTKSAYEHAVGGTVKVMEPSALPSGCCVLREGGLPCTYRMTHVVFRSVAMYWTDDPEPRVVVEGYCKTHRPKMAHVIELPKSYDKAVNGGRSAKSRMRRLEDAMYLNVVAGTTGTSVHKTLREDFAYEGANWSYDVRTVCDKVLKEGVIPTATEVKVLAECKKCSAQMAVQS
jgi:hypothetical protein